MTIKYILNTIGAVLGVVCMIILGFILLGACSAIVAVSFTIFYRLIL